MRRSVQRSACLATATLAWAALLIGTPGVSWASGPAYRGFTLALGGSGKLFHLDAKAPIAMVGLSWEGGRSLPEVRVKTPRGWSEWTSLEVQAEEGPDGLTAETRT
ncbi:MAG: hypothetical protein ACRDIF_04385, partial [Actinomycetota bacterium]